jgi:hypothetical protein
MRTWEHFKLGGSVQLGEPFKLGKLYNWEHWKRAFGYTAHMVWQIFFQIWEGKILAWNLRLGGSSEATNQPNRLLEYFMLYLRTQDTIHPLIILIASTSLHLSSSTTNDRVFIIFPKLVPMTNHCVDWRNFRSFKFLCWNKQVFENFLLGVMFEVKAFFVCTLDNLHKGCWSKVLSQQLKT